MKKSKTKTLLPLFFWLILTGLSLSAHASLIGNPVQINSLPGGDDNSSISFDGTNYLAAWQNSTGTATSIDIYGKVIDSNGNSIVAPFAINALPNDQTYPSVANYAAGQYLVVYQNFNGTDQDIVGTFVSYSSTTATVGTTFTIAGGAGNQQYPSIAYDGTTGFYVTYVDNGTAVKAVSVSKTGTVGTPVTLGTVTSNATPPSVLPQIAFGNSTIGYLVVWEDFTSTNDPSGNIYANTLTTTGVTGTVLGIAATVSFPERHPSVAFDGTNYLVVYDAGAAGSKDILAQRVTPSPFGLSGASFTVSNALNDQIIPRLTFSSGATLYFASWQDYRNSITNADIYGARIQKAGSMGPPLVETNGLALMTNTTFQKQNSVSGNDGNNFFALWTDFRNPPTSSDIWGQKVIGPLPLLSAVTPGSNLTVGASIALTGNYFGDLPAGSRSTSTDYVLINGMHVPDSNISSWTNTSIALTLPTNSSSGSVQVYSGNLGSNTIAVTIQDFSMTSSPSSLTIGAGGTGSNTLTLTALNGFSSAVSLSASNLPTGVSASFSANPVTPSSTGTSDTLTLTLSLSALPGIYTFQVTGNGGGETHIIALTLNIASFPMANTFAATSITQMSAILNGTVNPNGLATTAWFDYGVTSLYGSSTPSFSLSASYMQTTLSSTLSGLSMGTTYHFRMTAKNSVGTGYGGDLILTTIANPPIVITGIASNQTSTSAALNGTANPNGVPGNAWFEYGLTSSYGATTMMVPISGNFDNFVSINLFALSPYSIYHFRIDASNNGGTSYGLDQVFNTYTIPNYGQPVIELLTSPVTYFNGVNSSDYSGSAVANGGDINGDGIKDLVICADHALAPPNSAYPSGRTNAGACYIFFGRPAGWTSPTLLSQADLVVYGINPNDMMGRSVSISGDLNADGFADIVIGAPNASPVLKTGQRFNAGQVYVIYGRANFYKDFPSGVIDLSSQSPNVTITGANGGDTLGDAVTTSGDLNGDYIPDLVITAPKVNSNNCSYCGQVYIIFGKMTLPGFIDLNTTPGTPGGADVLISGFQTNGLPGSISTSGDVNGDGISDLIVGVQGYSPVSKSTGATRYQAGGAFLFYGRKTWSPSLNLGYADLTFNGINNGDQAGSAVSLGDLNKDGKGDIVIGARMASPNGKTNSGQVYIIFGQSSFTNPVIELNGANVTINGAGTGDQAGRVLRSTSDLNGDGYIDLLIGAPAASPGGRANAGSVYIILGKALFPSLINLTTGYDTVINGAYPGDFAGNSVDASGDINGDLIPDIVLGANYASPALKTSPYINSFAGQSYVIFGSNRYDLIPPSTPAGLAVVLTTDSAIGLAWTPSTDNVAVAGYEVYRNGIKVATVGSAKFTDSGLLPNTSYAYQVLAFDLAGNRSALSSTLTVSTLPDTVPPTSPTNLTAVAAGPSQINLSWGPGTDDVAVGGYQVWRSTNGTNFIQIANVPGTTFSSAGLSPSSLNYYYIKTYDTSGNVSLPSNTASATTLADTTPPTSPTGLHATTVSGTEIDLWWYPSTDNVGVAGYQIWRSTDNVHFTLVGTAPSPIYADLSLTTIQKYYYYVVAYDVAGNLSGASNTAYAVNDIIPPTAPATVTGTVINPGQINVSWSAATDNSGFIYQYYIYHSTNNVTFTLAGVVGGTSLAFSDTGLLANTSYYYYVKAADLAVNFSLASPTAGPYATPIDTTPPTAPTGLTVSGVGVTTIGLTWTASTDNSGTIASYQVWRALGAGAFAQIGSSTTTSFSDSGLAPLSSYSYYIIAVDPSNNKSTPSNTATATTLVDTIPPSVPSNLSAIPVSETQINLSWAPSVDNVAVLGYQIVRFTTTTSTVFTTASANFSDTGLTAWTTYSYTIRAFDTSYNYSGSSSAISATTLDQTKPTWPTGSTFSAVTAAGSAGASQINLSWSQAADNGVVAGYQIWRSSDNITFAQIGVNAGVANTAFASTGLQPSRTYYYYIIAVDGAGNLSAPSPTFSAATTADTTPPSVPSGLTVAPLGDSKLALTWTASTDNVAVAGYQIWRSTSSTGPFALLGTWPINSYTDSLYLVPSTTYYYYLVAYDSSGNLSAAGAIASGTTLADTTPPTVPRGIVASVATSQTQVNLTWVPSTDNSGTVSGYKIYRNGVYVGTALSNSYSDIGLATNQSYTYTIRAYDPYYVSDTATPLNISNPSAPVTAVTDVYPPTIPCSNLAAPCSPTGAPYVSAASVSEIDIAWSASQDIDLSTGGAGSGIAGYKVYRSDLINPIGITTASSTIFADKGLVPKSTYNYRVSAFDRAGNESAQSAVVVISTPPDTTPPSVPTNLIAALAAPYQINLNWAPSTDNDRVAGYKIYRNGVLYTFTTATSFSDAGLTPNTTYTYAISAYDRSGNNSAQSSPVSATTGP